MIDENKQQQALFAIHNICLELRDWVIAEEDREKLYEVADVLEYLIMSVATQRDMTAIFEKSLLRFCDKFSLNHIVLNYQSGISREDHS